MDSVQRVAEIDNLYGIMVELLVLAFNVIHSFSKRTDSIIITRNNSKGTNFSHFDDKAENIARQR